MPSKAARQQEQANAAFVASSLQPTVSDRARQLANPGEDTVFLEFPKVWRMVGYPVAFTNALSTQLFTSKTLSKQCPLPPSTHVRFRQRSSSSIMVSCSWGVALHTCPSAGLLRAQAVVSEPEHARIRQQPEP